LFSAAPAVALAGFTITILDKSAHDAHKSSLGMIAGSAGMVLYAVAVVPLLRRVHASHAALVGLGAWGVGAAVLAVSILLA
jgi:hypothetical protein